MAFPLDKREQHPLDLAREQLDDAAPILTGDPMTTAKVLVEGSAEREQLESLPDEQLLRQAARELAISVIVVARALMHQQDTISDKPGELGLLVRSLAACAVAIPAAFVQATSSRRDDGTAA